MSKAQSKSTYKKGFKDGFNRNPRNIAADHPHESMYHMGYNDGVTRRKNGGKLPR